MDFVAIAVVILIIVVGAWFVLSPRSKDLAADAASEVEEESVKADAVISAIYEQPVRSQASDVYSAPTPPAAPAPAVATPVEKKARKPRAKKEPKVEVIARAPFPPEKKRRRRKADAQ